MEKMKHHLYIIVFILTLLSIACTLLNSELQRNLYYIAIYLGILGIGFEHKNINFRKFNIAYPIILFGIVKLVWFFLLQHGPEGYDRFSDQLNGGKKLVLGGLLVFYLSQCRDYLQSINYKKIVLFVTGAAFLAASCYAIWQSMHGMVRSEMGTNRATLSAYIYSGLSVFLIFLLYAQRKKKYYGLAVLTIIFSFIIAILTGTRAVIIFHLPVVILMTAYFLKKIHLKSSIIIILISSLAIASLYNRYIQPKIIQTYNEVSLYQQGHDNTSLGARFSMWAVGLKNFMHAPLGQSFESRLEYSAQYVKEKTQHRSAMKYISVHLHDELIETLSLQGIFGGIALLWLYISIAWIALKNRNTPLLFTINCMAVYGLSDVLLLSSEAILFYISLIGLCSVISNPRHEEI